MSKTIDIECLSKSKEIELIIFFLCYGDDEIAGPKQNKTNASDFPSLIIVLYLNPNLMKLNELT
jgi:hypothetical protein